MRRIQSSTMKDLLTRTNELLNIIEERGSIENLSHSTVVEYCQDVYEKAEEVRQLLNKLHEEIAIERAKADAIQRKHND